MELEMLNSRNKKSFPINGTFSEQESYVNTLKIAETASITDDALDVVQKSERPFNLAPQDIPSGVDMEIFHHGIHEKKKKLIKSDKIT